jgi:hypothetical protein
VETGVRVKYCSPDEGTGYRSKKTRLIDVAI